MRSDCGVWGMALLYEHCEARDGKAMGWAEKLEGKANAKERGQPPMMTFFLSRILSEYDVHLVCFVIQKRTKHPGQIFTLPYILTQHKEGVMSNMLTPMRDNTSRLIKTKTETEGALRGSENVKGNEGCTVLSPRLILTAFTAYRTGRNHGPDFGCASRSPGDSAAPAGQRGRCEPSGPGPQI
jgi:hypothetical protein